MSVEKRLVGIVIARDSQALTLAGRYEELTVPSLDAVETAQLGDMFHVTVKDDGTYIYYPIPREEWMHSYTNKITGVLMIRQRSILNAFNSYIMATCSDFGDVATLDSLALDLDQYPDEMHVYVRRKTPEEENLWSSRGLDGLWIVCQIGESDHDKENSSLPTSTRTASDVLAEPLTDICIDAVDVPAPNDSSTIPYVETCLASSIPTSNADDCSGNASKSDHPKTKAIARLNLDVQKQQNNNKTVPTNCVLLNGVVTGVSADKHTRGRILVYVWTPGVHPGKEGILHMENGPKVQIGDWIQFPLSVEKRDRYLVGNCKAVDRFISEGSYTIIKPGYITRRVRDTIEFVLPRVTISNESFDGSYLKHPELELIHDPKRLLVKGATMDLLVLRFNPSSVGYKTCWKVASVQRSRLDLPATNDSSSYDHMQAPDDSLDNDVADPPHMETATPAVDSASAFSERPQPSSGMARMPQSNSTAPPSAPAPVVEFPRHTFKSLMGNENDETNRRRARSKSRPRISSLSGAANHIKPDVTPRDPSDMWTERALVVNECRSPAIQERKDSIMYFVWMIDSHREACLYSPCELKLGSCFIGLFGNAKEGGKTQIVSRKVVEMIPDVMECSLTNCQKSIQLLLYTEVINTGQLGFGNRPIARNEFLGKVEDSLLLLKPPQFRDERVRVIVMRLRTVSGKFGWTITGLQPAVSSKVEEDQKTMIREVGIKFDDPQFRATLEQLEPEVYRILSLHFQKGIRR